MAILKSDPENTPNELGHLLEVPSIGSVPDVTEPAVSGVFLQTSVILADHIPLPNDFYAQMVEDLGHVLYGRERLVDPCMCSAVGAVDYGLLLVSLQSNATACDCPDQPWPF